ncbi:MAG: BMP family protein [Desulfobacterales bacterium]|nr:BMP family protein [Desulfobacterales bacterium]
MRRFNFGTVMLVVLILTAFCVLPAGVMAAGKMLKIAIVAPSASNDLAFTQSIVDGINAVKKERPIDLAVTDGTFVVEDAAAAIRDYAKKGYDLVIAHGSQYGGSLKEIAKDFPKTAFAWGTSADTFGLPNVSSYEAASDEGGFVMGMMAAALSKKGSIGVVGPIEVGDAKLFVDGFVAGAKAQNPKIKANVNYIGSFSDVALAAEAARAHMAVGADVLTGTAQMVVGAIGAARSKGVAWFGTQADQTELAPEIVVACQVYKWEVILRQILADMDNGILGGKKYAITLANDGLMIEFNPKYKLPDTVTKIGKKAVMDIKSGKIKPLK